ncbi:MAG: hypothetical protein LUH07_06755, partial [Lachnospiraceae bacterium]|nr:hypothetical protein [Lachnospiraceae bacterium]
MTKNDWYKAGDQIKNLVQDAIDTGDFSQLGNTISDVISDAMDGLQGALHGDSGDKGQYGARGTTASHSGSTCDEYDQTYRGSEERARRAYEQTAGQGRQTYGRTAEAGGRNTRTYQPVPTGRKLPGEFGSRVMEYLGFGMGAIFGLGFGLSVLAAFAMDSLFLLWGSVSTVGLMCVVSLLLGMGGQRRLGVTRRFRRYCEVIGTRTYCKIEELAARIGENSGYVKKDLKKMIRRGYFPVGYLDRKETLLITDQVTYQQYLQAEEAYEKRQDEQKNAGKRTQEDTKESKRENTQENTRGAAASSSEQSSEQPVRTAEHQALIE